MRKHLAKLAVLIGLLAGLTLLFAVGVLAEDSITASLELNPHVLTGPRTVSVNINIANNSDDTVPISVTLYDPNNNVVSDFGSGGTAHLSPYSTQSYNGSWAVTQDQITKGRVTYAVQYTVTNSSGEKVPTRKLFSQSITHNTAKALAKLNRYSPDTVVEGQTVKITYELINEGTLDLTDIVITDPGITDEKMTYPLLKVGEKTQLSASYVAGATSRTTNPKITYKYVIGNKTESGEKVGDPKVIEVEIPDIIAKLSANQLIVNAGDKVDLTCVITNRSGLTYEQIKVTDASLGDVELNLSIGPQASKTITKPITVAKSTTYKFQVSGVDSTGTPFAIQSNELSIQSLQDQVDTTTIDVTPVMMNLLIEADRDIIHSQPSDIVFQVKVTNTGSIDLTNVEIATKEGPAAAVRKIKTIPLLQQGETYSFNIALTASMGGTYQFTASAKNTGGQVTTVDSNAYKVTFQATKAPPTPTPEPTADPTPTPEPTPTEDLSMFQDPNQQKTGTGTILLYVLMGLMVIILLAVGLLFYLDHRRNNPPSSSGHGGQNVVIDSIQRNPHRDYARAPKRTRSEPKRQQKAEMSPMPAYQADEEDAMDPYAAPTPAAAPAPRPPRAMQIMDVESDEPASAAEQNAHSAYKRPDPAKPAADDATKKQSDVSTGNTEVYNRDYLSKIRQLAAESEETPKAQQEAVAERAKPTLSEEDAALLSGSTGQYRLSRRSASVRAEQPLPAQGTKAEDPEAYARKRNAQRTPAKDLSDFYSDDDGDDEPTAKRRRRK